MKLRFSSPPDPPRRRSPVEILAGSDRWRTWSPARKLAFCYFVAFQFAAGFIVTVIAGMVVLELMGALR